MCFGYLLQQQQKTLVVAQSLSCVHSLQSYELYVAHQALLSSPPLGVFSNSCPLSRWCYLTIPHSLLLLSPLALDHYQHWGLFQWGVFLHRWPKDWSFSISSSNECSGLISFRIHWLDFLPVQGTLRNLLPALQFESINSLVLNLLFGPTLTSVHLTLGKTITLIIGTFVGKAMSLLFNTPFRFIIVFLIRSKHLLISWMLSISAVILESNKIKSVTVSIVSPSICHEVMDWMP